MCVVLWKAEVTISRDLRVMTTNHRTRTLVHALLKSIEAENSASSHPHKDGRAIVVATTVDSNRKHGPAAVDNTWLLQFDVLHDDSGQRIDEEVEVEKGAVQSHHLQHSRSFSRHFDPG